MDEFAIRDADVVDGSGSDAYRADAGVDDGRIVGIVKKAAAAGRRRPKARRELDAEGLIEDGRRTDVLAGRAGRRTPPA